MSRLSGELARHYRNMLIEADGGDCAYKDSTCKGRGILHHKNHDNNDNPPEGWRASLETVRMYYCIACVSHNARLDPRTKQRKPKFSSFLNFRHTQENNELKAAQRERLGIRGIGAELEKSERIKPKILDWIVKSIETEGRLELNEAINSGAFIGNCNQGTVKKYIDSWTSKAGPLRLTPDEYLILKSSIAVSEVKVKSNGHTKEVEV